MNWLPKVALLGLMLTLVPAALAGNETACPDGTVAGPEGCSQQAGIDCPPDAFCIAQADGNGTEPLPMGPEGCIDCSGPGGPSCMDGTGVDCRGDVYYLGGEPGRGPADGSCDNCHVISTASGTAANEAAGLGAAAVLGVAALAVLVMRRN